MELFFYIYRSIKLQSMRTLFLLSILFLLIACSKPTDRKAIPFEKDGFFYVTAYINDSIQGRFVFDTGADGLYIDEDFLVKHPSLMTDIPDTSLVRGAGSTGWTEILVINNPVKITMGKEEHTFTGSPILKMSHINGKGIAGMIGNEFIKDRILIVDNEKQTLCIDTVVDKTAYNAEIPFEYDDGRIYVKLKVNIKENKQLEPCLLLDMGCTDAIYFNSNYYNKNIADQSIENITYTILHGGITGGNISGGDFRAHSIALGETVVNNPILCFSSDTLGAFSNTRYDGLIGNELLDRFYYAIDYRNEKLYVMATDKVNNPFKATLLGFYAMKRGDIATVESIYDQYDAHQKGLQLGDTITAIGGISLSEMTDDEMKEGLKKEGQEVTITIQRGTEPIEIIFIPKRLL